MQGLHCTIVIKVTGEINDISSDKPAIVSDLRE
jgi:hypothetical protein